MVFFLSPDGKVYARYGGRDGQGPDERQSLDGLRYTMSSVLEMHGREEKAYAPRTESASKTVREIAGARRRGCLHCHNVREALNAELKRAGKWQRDLVWSYPLPDNLGIVLEVDRGNVVKQVVPESSAARVGLRAGDVLRRLNGVPIHSLGDAQFALDRAPRTGAIPVAWQRGREALTGALALTEGWRKSDISWRTSLQRLVPDLPLFGQELTAAEKAALGIAHGQAAFRHREQVHSRARAAGIQGGDVVLGIEDRPVPGAGVEAFRDFVRREYVVGDRVTINVVRAGKRLRLPLTLP